MGRRRTSTAVLALALSACAACSRFDAGTEGDAAASDASCVASPPGILLCTEQELEANTQTWPGDPRQVLLPASADKGPYKPNCMVVRAGQTVTWTGRIADHPLQPRDGGSLGNPIPEITRDVSSVPVAFRCPGDFNFGCKKHGGAMSGTIRVLP